ncbi:MAG: hydroxyacid dehydrogenase [Candidatus Heimdallarchaeum aukensis]|uniref:Hydroxyacid dehydrogenase n=1 Tax=Candidatus Heimdallarchaeum aukensis TaxID=2876573 RepID=A0A9Y1BMH0_9ARCH|nr:MAG: hydroxyacid dehydrogenase [Candidatus Heimdallarchaeum aukensis]
MFKVLIADKLNEVAVEMLEKEGFEVKKAWDVPKEELEHIIPEYDAIIVRSATKVKGHLLEVAKNLKVIGRAGVGLDNIDLQSARERGIKVINTPNATTNSVAELALTMILAATRRVVTGTERLRKNPSEFKKLKKELFSVEIEGKTLGIIGTGRIGSSLAVKAKALGMKTIGYDAYIKQSGVIDLQSSIDKVFEKADYISLHLPLTDETRHMISDEAFEKMKTNVVLINCARGGVVDEEAAYRALEKGKLAVYATDVFEKEPPKEENKLLKHPNVIMTPHIGAQTLEGNYRASVQVAEKVIEALKELK